MSREDWKQVGRDAANIFGAMAGGTLGGGRTVATPPVGVGTTVYRVYGGESRPMGTYWTTVNPNATRNFAAGAGLPSQNQMTNVVQGRITDMSGVRVTTAAPGAHGPGGLPEVQIPNAAQQVNVTGVQPFNPIPQHDEATGFLHELEGSRRSVDESSCMLAQSTARGTIP